MTFLAWVIATVLGVGAGVPLGFAAHLAARGLFWVITRPNPILSALIVATLVLASAAIWIAFDFISGGL